MRYEPASARTVLQDVSESLDEYDPPLQYRKFYSFTTVVLGALAPWHGSHLLGATGEGQSGRP